jgi:probable rRNA maturation factor
MKILIRNRQRYRPLDKTRLTKAAASILTFLNQTEAELSILFVGDKKMKELNSSYRGKNKSTDVLSFEAGIPMQDSTLNNVLGDIVINIPRAESQAEEYGTTFYDELYRLLIHGTLHLVGYDHELSKYEERKMIKKEKELFNAVAKVD